MTQLAGAGKSAQVLYVATHAAGALEKECSEVLLLCRPVVKSLGGAIVDLPQ